MTNEPTFTACRFEPTRRAQRLLVAVLDPVTEGAASIEALLRTLR